MAFSRCSQLSIVTFPPDSRLQWIEDEEAFSPASVLR
jgi:hypothetical protein